MKTLPRWSKSPRESRVRNLRDLDFLALVVVLGLLVLLFRRIEGWLHQHIFKVGWLLTNDFQITTVLYYIAFLPGIALRELTLWLAAGILNVRGAGALRFPEEQDISELRLSFVRLAPETNAVKRRLISLSPLATGFAALWAISAGLFPSHELIALATPGSVNELGAAIAALTQRGNFWLWLYIVFTIANLSFPAPPMNLTGRRKAALMLALPALVFSLWRAFDAVNPAIAHGIEGLLRGLVLIIAQIILLNIGVVLVLGGLEAVIERISRRSATFRDGRMIVRDGNEAAQSNASPMPDRTKPANPPGARQLKSIYDLKLPIPGPPGREPVSRKAVALARPNHSAAVLDRQMARPQQPIPGASDPQVESARASSTPTRDATAGGTRHASAEHDPVAPFARPFLKSDAPESAAEQSDETADNSASEHFARPFVMPTRAALLASERAKADARAPKAAYVSPENSPVPTDSRRRSGMTRPAPKPSQKATRAPGSASAPEPDELVYEDLDEIDVYDPGDDSQDDAL